MVCTYMCEMAWIALLKYFLQVKKISSWDHKIRSILHVSPIGMYIQNIATGIGDTGTQQNVTRHEKIRLT